MLFLVLPYLSTALVQSHRIHILHAQVRPLDLIKPTIVSLIDILFAVPLGFELLWDLLIGYGVIWRARSFHVLDFILCWLRPFLLLLLILGGESIRVVSPRTFILLILVRRTSRPLLNLDHQLLATAAL